MELNTGSAVAHIMDTTACNAQHLREDVRDEAKHDAGGSSRDLVVAGGRKGRG